MTKIKERIRSAEERTNTDPSERQKLSGNYKKGKVTIRGFNISIENPVGSIRRGIDAAGNSWENVMPYTYGYFRGTIGKDGDPLDVYLGPEIDQDFDVYVIDQVDEETRAFDEHKVMFGFSSEQQAKEAYLSCFNEGWSGFNRITTMSVEKFRDWIKNADMIKYPASRMNMSSKIDFKNEVASENRIKIISLTGEVKEDETLLDLQEQAGDINDFDTLVMEIASPGGSVSEGLQIMMWLDRLSSQNKRVVTIVTANAYSIASLIMLAADHRLISKHGKVLVHNPMIPTLEYVNANELECHIAQLRDLEATMYELYQLFTGLSLGDIKELMDNETYLSPQEAVRNGFADAVIDIKPKPYEVAANIKKEINMSKTLNILNKVIAKVNGADFVNQFYYDVNGSEIQIFQNDPSTYGTGDRTSVESGEVKLSDGSTLKIEDYVITEIDKSIEEPVAPENPEEPVAPENPEEPVAPENPEEPVAPENPEEPVAPENPETPKKKDDMPSSVIETVESTKTTKEIVAEENAEASFNEGPTPAKSEMVSIDPETMALIQSMAEEIRSLKERLTTLEEGGAATEAKLNALDKFEEVATEAIETIAMNTSSSFKPEAKKVNEQPTGQGKSIFQRMKEKRGM